MNILSCVALSLACSLAYSAETPGNQIFQFTARAEQSWLDGVKTSATTYLWIPEKCRRVRGLLILGSNVPEHMLVGNAAIREVCARNDLGIVWSTPTFWYYKSKANEEDATIVGFLQRLLDRLADVSGYEEVAQVPWLPLGESGHLRMVDALVEAAPRRCMAGIWLKNAHLPPHNRTTPALVIYGSAQEWGQEKSDLRKRGQDVTPYEIILRQRLEHPNWPLSFVWDGGSGHFDVSERLVRYIARYIDRVAKGPVPVEQGFLAGLLIPGDDTRPARKGKLWYFDRASAEEAQAISAANWNAEPQLPRFFDADGRALPFHFNGITDYKPVMGADGITFRMRAAMLDRLPENFVGAGEALTHTPGQPAWEWLCGAVTSVDGIGTFQVALDRTYRQQAIYLAARQPGNGKVRDAVQPVHITLEPNNEGTEQRIAFGPLADVPVGTKFIPLRATSDSGLPVQFFVVSGPAIVQDNRLVFTRIPSRSRLPLEVTVVAWQWGRNIEPKIKTAPMVRQTFRIVPLLG